MMRCGKEQKKEERRNTKHNMRRKAQARRSKCTKTTKPSIQKKRSGREERDRETKRERERERETLTIARVAGELNFAKLSAIILRAFTLFSIKHKSKKSKTMKHFGTNFQRKHFHLDTYLFSEGNTHAFPTRMATDPHIVCMSISCSDFLRITTRCALGVVRIAGSTRLATRACVCRRQKNRRGEH